MNTKITGSKEQFVLAEIQRQISEPDPSFITWDCGIPNQDRTMKKNDIVWGVKDTLIHVEVDKNGERHEDDTERIVAIHAASNLLNHVLIRFQQDKTSDGNQRCLKRTHLRNGDMACRRHLPEWNRRISVLLDSVRGAFDEALDNAIVTTGKRELLTYIN